MREICVVERRYAMTSGMTLLLTGCIGNMSQLRRLSHEEDGGQGSNQSTSSNVRKNLFGPIDHDENRKFVQDEQAKISRADAKRWNFDFQSGVPKEGRYMWEKVAERVPQAYDLSRMPFLSVHAAEDTTTTTTTTTAVAPTTTTTTTTIPAQQQQTPGSSRVEEAVASSQPSTSALHKPSTSTQITTATTIISSPPTIIASPPTTISGPTTTIACPAPTIACPALTTTTATTTIQVDPTATTAQTTTTTTTTTRIPTTTTTIGELVVEQQQSFRTTRQTKPTQTPITEFMKIQKRGVSRKREDDQPPALVKRPKTTTS